MVNFINLDISKITKPTDYGFQKDSNPSPSIHFRLYDEHYVIDYDEFTELRLVVTMDSDNTTNVYTLKSSDIVTINAEKFVKWTIPSTLLDERDKFYIDATVKMFNKTVILKRFKVLVYEEAGTGMNGILQAIRNFNYMYSLYLDSIKRTEIGQPNGVVPLESDGKFDMKYLPDGLQKHIPETLYDTLFTIPHIHGMRLNRQNYDLEILNTKHNKFYEANAICGGSFDAEPDDEMEIYGGRFTTDPSDEDEVYGGDFI